MNAAALRKKMKIKLKKFQTIIIKAGNSSTLKHGKYRLNMNVMLIIKLFFYCNAGRQKVA